MSTMGANVAPTSWDKVPMESWVFRDVQLQQLRDRVPGSILTTKRTSIVFSIHQVECWR